MPDTLNDINDAADALCDPRHHAEPRWEWDAARHKKPLDPHTTVVPGLIQQLRDLAEPGNDGEPGGRGGPESVPVAIDAVSLLASITHGSALRVAAAIRDGQRIEARTGPESCIRALVGVAARMPHHRDRVDPYGCATCRARDGRKDAEHWSPCHVCQPTTQTELLSELRSWQWQAEIITGWRTPPRELPAPCMRCNARGTLLAYADEANPKARCVGCGAQWAQVPVGEEGPIGLLAEHVIGYQRRSGETGAALRAAAVQARRRRDGHAEGGRSAA